VCHIDARGEMHWVERITISQAAEPDALGSWAGLASSRAGRDIDDVNVTRAPPSQLYFPCA
jgi:hypothetical protein